MLPEKLREKAYLNIVCPGLEYASAITDPHSPGEIKTLNKVQCQAARYVTNNPRTRYTPETEQVSVSGLIDRLQWPSLEERKKNTRCTLMFRVKHGLVSVPPSTVQTSIAVSWDPLLAETYPEIDDEAGASSPTTCRSSPGPAETGSSSLPKLSQRPRWAGSRLLCSLSRSAKPPDHLPHPAAL